MAGRGDKQRSHLRPPVRLLVRALAAWPPALLWSPCAVKPPLNPRLPAVDPIAGGDDCALSIRFLPSVLLRWVSRGDAASSADKLLFVGDEVGLQDAQSQLSGQLLFIGGAAYRSDRGGKGPGLAAHTCLTSLRCQNTRDPGSQMQMPIGAAVSHLHWLTRHAQHDASAEVCIQR